MKIETVCYIACIATVITLAMIPVIFAWPAARPITLTAANLGALIVAFLPDRDQRRKLAPRTRGARTTDEVVVKTVGAINASTVFQSITIRWRPARVCRA